MITLKNNSLVKAKKASSKVKREPYKHRLHTLAHSALPVTAIRITVERMIPRIIHISQPHNFWYVHQHEGYYTGIDETDDNVAYLASICILVILLLLFILVLLRKYEKENEKY